MAQRPSPPRGMRDLLPEETSRRVAMLSVIRDVYKRYGFMEIETPALEDLRILGSSDGGENEKLIYQTLRRGLALETIHAAESMNELVDLGLRFDLTVPLARYVASNEPHLRMPFRAFQTGPVWRAERPQRGRYRQFTQCDIDIIGESSILAEVELLTATAEAISALGLGDFTIRLGDRRLLTDILRVCGFSKEDEASVLITVDKLDKIGLDGVAEQLSQRYPASAVEALIKLLADAHGTSATNELSSILPAGVDSTPLAELSAIIDACQTGSKGPFNAIVDLSLVRGMGYYTGPIFEIVCPGDVGSVAGGGRYDGMIGRFLNRPVPACGFSIGFERIYDVLSNDNGGTTPHTALLYEDSHSIREIAQNARKLRDDGIVVEPIRNAGKKLFTKLRESGFTHTVRLGSETSQEL